MLKSKRKRFKWQVNYWTDRGHNQRRYFKTYGDAFEFFDQLRKQGISVRGPFDNRSNGYVVTEHDIDSAYRRYYGF